MRQPYSEIVNHRLDRPANLGFDYRGQVLKRTLSPVLYAEPKRAYILGVLDSLMVYLIDSVKHIKKTFNYTLPKYYRDFN